jgi:succinyl-diaminopimelate desuccinylase
MKGSLAAMVVATERFVAEHPDHKGSIAFLITSDEEGPFINGTVRVIDTLEARNEKIRWCIVGEPSSTAQVGDVVKNGRRGSITGDLLVRGVQGHVAYPHLADNPIHKAAPALAELAATVWDEGNAYFPHQLPDSQHPGRHRRLQRHSRRVAGPVQLPLQHRAHRCGYPRAGRGAADPSRSGLRAEVDPLRPALPDRHRRPAGGHSRRRGGGERPATGPAHHGGTSDGRFIAPTGAEVIELGPVNATIHKVNECVKADDLDLLADMYQGVLELLAGMDPDQLLGLDESHLILVGRGPTV